MDCLVLPIVRWRRRSVGSRLGYRLLSNGEERVRVVVGKEKREFLVDPFVLEEDPFRMLMSMLRQENRGEDGSKRAIYVDVDAILFEHLLWLMYNDCSSLFKLNLREVVDFYAHDF